VNSAGKSSVFGNFFSRFRPTAAVTERDTALLEAVLHAIQEAAFVLDTGDRVLQANDKGRALMAGRDNPAATLSARLGSSSLLAALQPRLADNAPAPRRLTEFALHRAPFPDLWFTGSITPLPGAAPRRLVILTDITRRKFLETVQHDFVANLSHDLRTPITILKGYADVLHDDYDKLDDTQRRRFTKRVHSTMQRLNRLLEGMTRLALLEHTPAPDDLKRGALNTVLAEAADWFADRVASRGVRLELALRADDSAVPVVPGLLLSVAVNLLENVLKHGSGATVINISSESLAGGGVAVEVADDGTGVADLELPRIFDRFFRADKSRAKTESPGLGLSIVKHIVALHGGTVAARAGQPHGLVVRMEVPPAGEATAA
jgi:signal transduction histidine kinase